MFTVWIRYVRLPCASCASVSDGKISEGSKRSNCTSLRCDSASSTPALETNGL